MTRWIVIIGIIFILVGLAWPWLSKLGIGHVPGDMHVERKGFGFYFPVTSSVMVSLVLSLLFRIFRR